MCVGDGGGNIDREKKPNMTVKADTNTSTPQCISIYTQALSMAANLYATNEMSRIQSIRKNGASEH